MMARVKLQTAAKYPVLLSTQRRRQSPQYNSVCPPGGFPAS